ncbi:hypothetical protein M758_1G079300, partial [Ceratodon purpureus]
LPHHPANSLPRHNQTFSLPKPHSNTSIAPIPMARKPSKQTSTNIPSPTDTPHSTSQFTPNATTTLNVTSTTSTYVTPPPIQQQQHYFTQEKLPLPRQAPNQRTPVQEQSHRVTYCRQP